MTIVFLYRSWRDGLGCQSICLIRSAQSSVEDRERVVSVLLLLLIHSSEFPRLDDIHPFYADLFNIQYDRDHYKLALGAVNACRGTVDKLSKDYVKMLKYADSMFKCKSLKVAALGRMSTMVGKLSKELTYLEEVRQHMSRLPTINPSSRTLILCGFPNVGKSSFLNCVSQANVDVSYINGYASGESAW